MRRLLIVRPDNIGDVILFSGAFRHLRALYPRSQITLAVQSHIVELVKLCPYVDKVVSVDDLLLWRKLRRKRVRGSSRFQNVIRSIDSFWRKLLPPFNLVIFPVKSPQPSHLQLLGELNAKRTIGMLGCRLNLPKDDSQGLQAESLYSDSLDISRKDPWRHELLTTLDFLKFLQCEVHSIADIQPEFWISRTENHLLRDYVDTKGTILGLFPGAADAIRCWSKQNYGKLAKAINGVDSYVIFGGQDDVVLAAEISTLLRKAQPNIQVVDLSGKTSLQELYKCISDCSILISMDSSGLHMGISAGVPTVGIVGGGHYGRFVPWGDKAKHIILTKRLDCFYCNWRCDSGQVECIQAVTPDEVASAVNGLLKNLIA